MEMQQLLNMGFPDELAAQALAATGGKSTVKATEWILNHKSNLAISTNSPSSPSASPTPSPFSSQSQPQSQRKLDRFFNFPSKSSTTRPTLKSSTPPPSSSKDHGPETPLPKRPRSSPPPTPNEPLAERMRPRSIDDVIGQEHILGPNALLRSSVNCNRLPSILLWGPPGTGKTSIAKAIANSAGLCYRFVSLSAVTAGVKDVREAVDEARKLKGKSGKRTVLFVDEVHRFNKSQQDSFLPVIEDGSIVFIGATTENPSFHLITPLLSRCRVLTLNALKPTDVEVLLKRAVGDSDKGLSQSVGMEVEVDEEAIQLLSSQCDGDARVALNALEVSGINAASRVRSPEQKSAGADEDLDQNDENPNSLCCGSNTSASALVTVEDAKEALQCKHLAYDKAGEEHYNLISALHKSMRGNDANAAIYWLARMLEGGEQPLYIARRLVRFASEDVGLADPGALTQAVACYQACHFIGMPECNVILAQCAAYLALAPKSIAVYKAFGAAQKVVRESVGGNQGVPLHLRNAPTKLMKDIGYGKGYIYTPDDPSAPQSFLPPSLEGYKFLDWPYSSNGSQL